MQIIDTHAHLDHCEDLEAVLKRAQESGVECIVAVSEDLASSKKNLEISKKFKSPKVYCAAGIHPSEADINELDETLSFIRAHSSELIAIGEIGLDFWYKWVKKDAVKKEEQLKVFQSCLELAKELDLPVSIHSRGAWRDCLDMVKKTGIKKAVFHWYSGPIDVLREILSNGFFISATPSLAYSQQAREAITHAPIEQTLIETDTPVYYSNKEKNEGFVSEPKDVLKTLKIYCEIKKINEENAVEIFNKNAKVFFNVKD